MREFALFFLAPPGLMFLPAFLGLYHFFKRPKVAWRWLLAAVVLAWVFSTPAMGRFLSTALISQVTGPRLENPRAADAIILLTGGMDYVGNGGWLPSRSTYQRAMIGLDLQQKVGSRTPIIISGGRTGGPRHPSEAEVTRLLIDRQQAQITPIILEETSLDTRESSTEVARMLDSRNARRVYLLTSETHMLRALAAYRRRGVDPVPIMAYELDRGPLSFHHFIPQIEGALITHRAMYEILAISYALAAGHIRWSDLSYSVE